MVGSVQRGTRFLYLRLAKEDATWGSVTTTGMDNQYGMHFELTKVGLLLAHLKDAALSSMITYLANRKRLSGKMTWLLGPLPVPTNPWGVTGLYRGATSSFVGVAFESSLFFGMYSQMKQSLQGSLQSSGPDPLVIIPSAACSGAAISFVLCPSELLKCRMQVQGTDSLIPNSVRYKGPIDCALRTIETEGVKGIFRGGVATLLRESLGGAVFFSVYEYVRHFMHSKLEAASHDHKSLTEFGIGVISGGLGGVAFWSAVLPLDVAKTIIQTDLDIRSTRNPFQVLHSVYRMAGIRGCYAGLGPTLLRAFPANAAAIVTLEFAIKILGIRRE